MIFLLFVGVVLAMEMILSYDKTVSEEQKTPVLQGSDRRFGGEAAG